jgi:TonB family protein
MEVREYQEQPMFSSNAGRSSLGRRYWISASVLLHVLVLWLVVHRPSPTFIKVNQVREGRNGASVSIIYSPYDGFASAEHTVSQSDSSLQSAKLHLNQPAHSKARSYAPQVPAKGNASTVAENSSSASPPAGKTSGTSLYGDLSESEIRPALPVYGPYPRAGLAELPNRQEGNVIIEITIDEQGKIVQTKVLQSMGADIDALVLHALAEWRFKPATKDGVPIASLQDVYFHFPT